MRATPLDDVTIGIPTMDDDPATLRRVLAAATAEPVAAPLVVVDMSRTDVVRDISREFGNRVRLVAFPDSTGVSDSRNRIAAEVGTRYLLMVDADAEPRPGWAAAMRCAFDEVDGVAVVGARCLPLWDGRPPPLFTTQTAGDFLAFFDLGDAALDVPRIMGTSYALDLSRIPDPPFATSVGRRPGDQLGMEENVLCLAARRAGWRVRYEPGAVVSHHVRAGRASWRWMQRRAYVAGRESRVASRRPEPLPRALGVRDRAFLAAIAPAFMLGRLRRPASELPAELFDPAAG